MGLVPSSPAPPCQAEVRVELSGVPQLPDGTAQLAWRMQLAARTQLEGLAVRLSSYSQLQVVVFVSQSATLREARFLTDGDIQSHCVSYSSSVIFSCRHLLLEGQRSSGTQAVGQGGLCKARLG